MYSKTTGTVDTDTVGSYEKQYTTTDPSGNTVTKTRTVNIVDTTNPTISINGEENITLELGENYSDAGATCEDNVSCDLQTTGTDAIKNAIDNKLVDTFTITYTATDPSGNMITKTRTVKIVDTTKPTLTLNGEESLTLEAGVDSYEEKNAKCSDIAGCEITIAGKVDTKKTGNYEIIYTATDKNKNISLKKRSITVVDTTNPTLTLKGNDTIDLEVGETYTDAGATCTDNVSCEVQTTGIDELNEAIKNKTLGTYTVTYTATDKSGNTTTKNRVINLIDTKEPTLKINGEQSLTLEAGVDSYEEQGATCDDNAGCTVETTGTVDTTTP